MKKGCSIRDVAQKAGVSICAVSQVLNGQAKARSFSPAVRKHILKIAKEMKYVPNINAKRLFSARSNVLGLLMPYSADSLGFTRMNEALRPFLAGASPVIRKAGKYFLLLSNDKQFRESGEYLTLFRSKMIDAMVTWCIEPQSTYLKEIDTEGMLNIYFANAPMDKENFNYVIHDHFGAAEFTVTRLLARGVRRFHWIFWNAVPFVSMEMELGIRSALCKAGLNFEDCVKRIEYNDSSAFFVPEYLPSAPSELPQAILCTTSSLALRVKTRLHEFGFESPRDYYLCGFNGRGDECSCFSFDQIHIGELTAEATLKLLQAPEEKIHLSEPWILSNESTI